MINPYSEWDRFSNEWIAETDKEICERETREDFLFWARQYQEAKAKIDLLAVGQYWGMLCVLHDGHVPEDLTATMKAILEEFA